MYALTGDKFGFNKSIQLHNEKLKRFGDYAVVVTDVKAFLDRLKAHTLYKASLIKYIDFFNPLLEDKKAIFNPVVKKHKYFELQSEFRIYSPKIRISKEKDLSGIFNNNYKCEDSIELNIGNIFTITSRIYSTDELFSGVSDITLERSSAYTNTRNLDLTTIESYNRNIKRN